MLPKQIQSAHFFQSALPQSLGFSDEGPKSTKAEELQLINSIPEAL